MNIDPHSAQRDIDFKQMEEFNELAEKVQFQKIQREKTEYEANLETIAQSEILKEIAENTAYLKDIVGIVRETKLNGDELNLIMRAIFEVGSADNKEEADGLFKTALDKINSAGESVGNIVQLIGILKEIYSVVSNYF